MKSDGTAWCWGRGESGSIGNGVTSNQLTPVQVNTLTNVTNIDAGLINTCAIKSDNTLWCWGYNTSGQL